MIKTPPCHTFSVLSPTSERMCQTCLNEKKVDFWSTISLSTEAWRTGKNTFMYIGRHRNIRVRRCRVTWTRKLFFNGRVLSWGG